MGAQRRLRDIASLSMMGRRRRVTRTDACGDRDIHRTVHNSRLVWTTSMTGHPRREVAFTTLPADQATQLEVNLP